MAIQIATSNLARSDIYAATRTVVITAPGLAASAEVTVRVTLSGPSTLTAGDRTIHFEVFSDSAFYTIYTKGDWTFNVAAGQGDYYFVKTLGPFIIPLNADLSVSIKSDNSNDTDVAATTALYTTDADYIANLVAATTSPAADSLAERIKAVDDLAGGATGFAAIDTVADAIKVKTDYLPSVTAGAAGGLFIAGTNAQTTITTSLIVGAITLTTPIQANIAGIKTTALPAEAVSGQDAAGFAKFFDVATPVFTCASVNQTGDSYALANGAAGFVAIDTIVDAIKVVTDKVATVLIVK